MDIRLFAERYRLKAKKDECGDPIIPGRLGQIYEYGPEKFGCMVLAGSSRVWSAARRKLVVAGCQVIQNGDTEGTALFDPQDAVQARMEVQIIRAKRKRVLCEAQKAALEGRLQTSLQDAATADMPFISLEGA